MRYQKVSLAAIQVVESRFCKLGLSESTDVT